MKVLYLLPQPKKPGRIGAYTFLDEEIHAMAAAGIDCYVLSTAVPEDVDCGGVRLLSADARTSISERWKAAGFLTGAMRRGSAVHARHPLMWYRSAWREYLAAQIVVEHRIDVIHSHFAWPTGSGGMLASAATGRPLVASFRGTDILLDRDIGYGRRASPLFDRALRGLLKDADRTVYFSGYMRDYAISLGARPEAARVIRKGVDLGHFTEAPDRAALKRELGLGSDPMVLTVGGLIRRKGIHHLLEALGRLRDEHAFTFVVCGDGPERRALEELSERLGLGQRTLFLGRVDRNVIPRYFAACDVFALASSVEAAGNVLFEAMASARPVVCTNAGGPQEYVADGETGFVVPVADVEALRSRIGRLLADPALRDGLGREGRRRTLTQFTYDRMVGEVIDVYEDVLGTQAPARVAV
jgi:glycosyltransferase involved in cell wall biosynthesis